MDKILGNCYFKLGLNIQIHYIESADSGYVVTGMTETDEEGDVLLIKTDEYGNAD